jgi:vacuolar protein sorting-associated protein 26
LYDQEEVSGKIIINIGSAKTFEHKGIKLELLGVIENLKDKKDSLKFISLTNELESIGMLNKEVTTYPFKFSNVQKLYETYRGNTRNVKYLLKLSIETKFRSLNWEQEFAVINPRPASILDSDNQQIKLEVGIEEWLHLIFDVDCRKFGLKDVAHGRVTFKKVSIRLKSMEIQIIRKETPNTANAQPDSTVITKFEIMDGGPIKNETIPIRFFLKPYDLTPTMMNINNKFSVQYFINLVLTDVEDRKYFKQHEIFFHRIQKVKKKKSESEDNGITEIKNEVKNENKNVISNESDNGNTNDGNNNEEEKLDE